MIIEDAKTTRGADVVSTIRASYYKTGERNIRENIVSGKGYEGVIEETKCVGGLSDKKWSDKQYHQQHRVYKGDVALCLPANLPEGSYKYVDRYRIRKLTPRECWRLMGYTDEDFDKAAAVNSNTQLYKQAGNAIVRAVLMALFLQLNIQGIKNWNDRTDDEKRALLEKAK